MSAEEDAAACAALAELADLHTAIRVDERAAVQAMVDGNVDLAYEIAVRAVAAATVWAMSAATLAEAYVGRRDELCRLLDENDARLLGRA